jgi:hypothetical protein
LIVSTITLAAGFVLRQLPAGDKGSLQIGVMSSPTPPDAGLSEVHRAVEPGQLLKEKL